LCLLDTLVPDKKKTRSEPCVMLGGIVYVRDIIIPNSVIIRLYKK